MTATPYQSGAAAGLPWASTPAAVKAELAWPDGKLELRGLRIR